MSSPIAISVNKTGFTFVFLLLFSGAFLTSMGQGRAFFTVNGKKVNIDHFNQQIDSILRETGIPGLSLAIIDNNKIVFSDAYGYKELGGTEKVDKNTIFEGCSLSKSFLVYLAYKLVDEKKLDLDKPLYNYLEYEELKDDPRYQMITARMVLNHSSGMENWQGMNNPNKLEILNNPGEKFIYSGEAYHYMARVFEILLKMPYEAYIEKMVYKPLKLKRTYSNYSSEGNYPENFAVGHEIFGKKVKKMKNLKPVPAAGNHFTAEDYAKLVIATFDGKHLSADRKKDILQPLVSLKEYASVDYYYGQGYEMQFNKGDTIISQGGSNPGFKALVYYSIVSKSGIVFMTNSDRGKWIAEKLSGLSVGLDVHPFFEKAYEQYPSYTIGLLKVYKEGDTTGLFSEIARLRDEKKLREHTLNELGDMFLGNNPTIAKKLFELNIVEFPQSSKSFYLLGNLNMRLKKYDVAYANLLKAKDLKSKEPDLEKNINKCQELLKKR
jgi:CubicO group peptidase (beta-lactamase class C family)